MLGVCNIPVDKVGYLFRLALIFGLKQVGDLTLFSKTGAVSHSFSLKFELAGSASELEDGGLVLSLLIVLWYVFCRL